MKAMILAAGRGSRMGTLTENTPKPLLKLGDKTLIDHQLTNIAKSGIKECLVNVHYHADKIIDHVGNGGQYGINVTFSEEEEKLETGGGIIKALDYFENAPFLLLSADIVCDYPLKMLEKSLTRQAHLILVPNPDHHPEGDFYLSTEDNLLNTTVNKSTDSKYTYGNIGIYHPDLFKGYAPGYRKLADILKDGITRQQITGELYEGQWLNTDTPERLAQAKLILKETDS